jgi:hypothetical protein
MHTVEGYVPSSPAVAGGIVYVGTGMPNTVYAVNASTYRGTKLWVYMTDGAVFSSPAVASGVVYFGTNGGSILALNASTGEKIWSQKTNDPIYSSPAIAYGAVFVGSNDHRMYAFNASTGAEIWSYKFGMQIKSSPAVVDGIIYAGCHDGKVYALELLGPAKSSNISCSVSPSIITKGDSFTVFGSIIPVVPNQSITLTYKKPGAPPCNQTVISGLDGSFNYSISPDIVGTWNVIVSWEGDATYEGATDSRSFIVSSQTYTEPGGVSKPASFFTYAIVAAMFSVGGYGTYLFRKKR